jgi:protein tyrosine phosphatase (PTP) superfamily phosphohydrolase (DUF442 family)
MLLCLFWAAAPLACQRRMEAVPASLGAAPATAPIRLEGVPAFSEVSEGLYRGGQPSSAGFAELKQMGIKTVISLRDSGSDYHDLTGTGLRYLPLYFNPAHPEEKNVFAFFKAASDPQNQPVFVHCCFGKDRTGMMVAVYRMATQDRSRGEAISEMKAMGFHSIWQQIDGYVKHMDIQRVKTQFASAPSPQIETVP